MPMSVFSPAMPPLPAPVRLLDCTLRDGGYANGWNFGHAFIRQFLAMLCEAGVDVVECGFITRHARENTSLFGRAQEAEALLPPHARARFVAMAIYGECELAALPAAHAGGLWGLRLSFDKEQTAQALRWAERLAGKGYALFLQPVRLSTHYSPAEVAQLARQAGDVGAHSLGLADTHGVLDEEGVVALYRLLDEQLAPETGIGCHLHNNRQLAFAGARRLLANIRRPLTLDACLLGMGKAAGNLPTELILHALVYEYGQKNYDFAAILQAADLLRGHLGHCVPTFGYHPEWLLCAALGCNPGYARFLQRQGVESCAALWRCLCRLPAEKRPFFEEEAAREILKK